MQNIRMWIERTISGSLRRMAKEFPAVLVTGPRQVGKTSLLRHLWPDMTYVSFDSRSLASQAEGSPDEFFLSLKEPVILDEIQYVPSIFRDLKARIDRNRRPGRFLLTGSQTFPLMQGVSESLAGRCGILSMHSLSWEEVAGSLPKFSDTQYVAQGGFPELYSGSIQKPSDWYAAYLERIWKETCET